MPGPVITLPLCAVTRITRGDRRTGTAGMDLVGEVAAARGVEPLQLGIGRLVGRDRAHAPRPWPICGWISGTVRGLRAQASSASTLAKRAIASSVFSVGVISLSGSVRVSAAVGLTQLLDEFAVVVHRLLPCGARATKKACRNVWPAPAA